MGLPVIAVSADEIVWALLRAGFEIRDRRADLILLARDGRVVEVPASPSLVAAELLHVLRHAGISYGEFIERLAEEKTQPDIDKNASQVRRRRRHA